MSKQTEELIRRLRKLLDHAESAEKIGNQAEAHLFAAKANELLLKYNLSMSQVEFAKTVEESPIDREVVTGDTFWPGAKEGKQRSSQTEDLAQVVAQAHFCRILVHERSDRLTFIGREQNRELAIWMFRYLAETALRLSRRAYRKARTEGEDTTNFGKSYWVGFTSELGRRYREEREKAGAVKSYSKNALVRLRTEADAVQDWMNANIAVRLARGLSTGTTNGPAFAAGARDARGVTLRSNVVKEPRPKKAVRKPRAQVTA